MLRKYCLEKTKYRDDSVPSALFAARESDQESLGFSPAELVFGHTHRGPLNVLQEKILSVNVSPERNVLQHVCNIRERLHHACSFARAALADSEIEMKKQFNRSAVECHFEVGDQVLALLPIPGSSLSAHFAGP